MKGEKVTPGAPPDQLFDKARKALTLMGHEGIAMIAVSGFDMACWDAYAQAQSQPLVEALGGKAAPVTAYNSCGLGIIEAKAAAEEAKKLLAEGGYGAVKVRLGRETLDEDLAVLGAVRGAVGADVILPVEFNQCLSIDDAIKPVGRWTRKMFIGSRSRPATTTGKVTRGLPPRSKRRPRTAKISTDPKAPPRPSRQRRWIT